MEESGPVRPRRFDHTDFSKVDVESSEKEVFKGILSWTAKIALLAIELPDWAKVKAARQSDTS